MSPWSAFYRRLATPVDRPAGIQVVHTVAPVEPPASTEERLAEVDRLIDLRQAIRPAPPLPEDPS